MTINRRELLVTTGTVVGVALIPSLLRAAVVIPKPPVARVVPVTETLFGTTLTDNYRWMETANDPDWMPYITGQNATARATLAAIPGRDALLKRISALSGDAVSTKTVQRAGALTFIEQRPAGANNFKLYVRGSKSGDTMRLLVDPETLGTADRHVSLDWWAASPDGSHLVYGLSPAGSEESVAHVMVVATAQILPERIPDTPYAGPSWTNDGAGFFYNQITGPRETAERYKNSRLMYHQIATDPASDRLIAQNGHSSFPIAEYEFPGIQISPDSDVAVALLFNGVARELTAHAAPTSDVLAGTAKWHKVCDPNDKITGFAVIGADLYLLANTGAIRGRVVKTSARAPDLKSAATILPMSAIVVEALTAARDGVYVTTMDGGIERLKRIGRDDRVADVALPYDGQIVYTYGDTGSDGIFINLTGWVEPSAVWAIDPATLKAADTRITPPPPIDLSPYVATRFFATAKDGVKIPVSVVARRDTPKDGKRPAIVLAYGAYQYGTSPAFAARNLAFLDVGGICVVAGVRGGGEYGREWHDGGKLATKPNTWRDLIASCEALIAAGWTRPASLAIEGGSAGGITVGRALTERPDLFCAVLSLVGSSNQLRAEFSPNGPANIPEFGSQKDEAGFRALLAMDAYSAVRKGTKYPAVLLTTGVSDPRVAPWEVGKMTAALQAATASNKPVLMRVDFDAGHGIGSTRSQTDDLQADEFAFVLWQAGVAGYQPAG
ncbi:prolyl oligopeptidase family serine peptidase [Sphingomonas oligophenolica]|uniref:prolyl oligopeptidase n=1 Tax=Sphingomonas oligophenolica TaxID=301154 RepID=A0A502BXV8_9SPHN|nr:prolyl oligopeptidase family serine peptidase [Sphingomonas oligophenolica]TPG05340.1 S9 family peptidase [Sphingomonas oligophenolica]